MKSIIEELKLDEIDTKAPNKEKTFTRVKDVVPLKQNLNFMADLLMLPDATINRVVYPYCLVVVDLATDSFDIEPVRNKEPKTILEAFAKINSRDYIKIDDESASLATDAGTEFKGVFSKWLYNESILHKIAIPNRHTQLSNVNYLCRQLGKLFNLYMNKKERETGKVYRNWTDIVGKVRDLLNKARKKKMPEDLTTYVYKAFDFNAPTNKYEVGDIVNRLLNTPENALGKKLNGAFREGDIRWAQQPYRITKVLYVPPPINYRYMLNDITNASFTETQLRPSEAKQEEFRVKKIIGKKKENGVILYLVWWDGYKKAESTWEPRTELMEDVPQMIAEYEKLNRFF